MLGECHPCNAGTINKCTITNSFYTIHYTSILNTIRNSNFTNKIIICGICIIIHNGSYKVVTRYLYP